MAKLTFVSGLYNENIYPQERLKRLLAGLKNYWGEDFEVILVENGSTDGTKQLLTSLAVLDNRIKAFSVERRGLGLAYKKGIEEATGDFVILSAIDLPFGFSDLEQVTNHYADPKKIWFFSKAHKESRYPRSLFRKIISKILNVLLFMLFRVNIKDTQGSVFLANDVAKTLLKYANSNTPFFTAQIAIYSQALGWELEERPVFNSSSELFRKSTMKIARDGLAVFFEIIRERFMYKRKLKSNNV